MTTTNTMKHIYKAGAQTDAPTILLLHGTGGTENDLIGLAEMIAPGAGILGVRGMYRRTGCPVSSAAWPKVFLMKKI